MYVCDVCVSGVQSVCVCACVMFVHVFVSRGWNVCVWWLCVCACPGCGVCVYVLCLCVSGVWSECVCVPCLLKGRKCCSPIRAAPAHTGRPGVAEVDRVEQRPT